VTIRTDKAEGTVQGKWLRLRAGDGKGRHGLVRTLSAKALSGQVVRLSAKVLHRGLGKVEATELPRVALEWQGSDGKPGAAALHLHAYPSPGWETCETHAAVPPGAKNVRLALTQQSTMSSVGLDDILVEWVRPLAMARAAGTTGERKNLIDGGDFEVGQRNFSVCGVRRPIGRGPKEFWACPLAWSFDDSVAAVGKRSLRIPLDQEGFRIAFGWVRVAPGKDYTASLYVRANTKVVLRLGVVKYPNAFHSENTFTVDETFRRIAVIDTTEPDLPWTALAVVIRPSAEPGEAYVRDPSHALWLDGVSLTQGGPEKGYPAPAPVEVGIVGPSPHPADIAHLVQIGKPAELTIRVANYQKQAYEGQLAIDIVDAFDRPVLISPQTRMVKVDPGHTKEVKLGPFKLPRGYYKALATAWPGAVGRGRPHSTAERAFGAVNLTDSVPTGNYFGMTVEGPRMSRRVTQLGAGWVWLRASREWCETSDGKLKWGWYEGLIDRARAQNLEVLADLSWTEHGSPPPTPGDRWREVCREFAKTTGASKGRIDGIGVLNQSGLAGMLPEKYATLLGQASQEIHRAVGNAPVLAVASSEPGADPFAWLKQAMKGPVLRKFAQGIALKFQPTPLPEEIEPVFDEIRKWRKALPFKHYVDVGVGQRGPTAYLHVPNLYGYRDYAVCKPDAEDPVLHASRIVRALAIRQFAMIDRAAWWVESYRPPDILRPTINPQCHEYDNAPRPSVVAFDFMAEMLNAAALVEWVDLPQEARALCFERADDRMVVLLWRPFGWSLRPVALRGLAGKVTVLDLFGRQELHPSHGGHLLVMLNESVRYLLVPAETKDQAMDALRRPILPAASTPAAPPPTSAPATSAPTTSTAPVR